MTAVQKLGFIGLGAMGRPMALNLMKAGHAMTVYARRAQALEPLVAAGARTAANPADVARAADVVFSLVTASADSEAVALGPDGILEGARPGCVVIDMATISPLATRRIAQALDARSIEHIDAPVSGGPAGAQGATLAIMAGGKPQVFAQVKPLFECLGKTILHMGDHGAGQVTKACNQLALTVTAQAAAEALALARSCGLDPARVLEALMGGVAASRVLDLFGRRMVRRDFGAGIDTRLYHKDLGIVLELAQEAGLPLPAGAVVKQQINALMGAGEGNADFSVLIRALERAAGQSKE
ncbi:MAG: NAD(P)-dependent oxidoreductase [Betaproteobacteria bacterium]